MRKGFRVTEDSLYCNHCKTDTIHGREKLHSALNSWDWVLRCYVCGDINKMWKSGAGTSNGKVKVQKDNVAVVPVPAKRGEDDGYRKVTSGGQEKVRRRGGG